MGTPDELACGALEMADASAPFQEAVREFEALLKREWDLDGPLAWEELKPDWWGADVVAGSLSTAGSRP